MQELFFLVLCRSDDVGQVLPFEAHLIGAASFLESQLSADVLHHLGCGRSGQGEHRHIGEHFPYLGDLEVGRSEVVSPLRDAVRLVDGNHTDVHLPQFGLEDFGTQPFGRDVKELEASEDAVVQCHDDFLARHPRVDGQCLDAPFAEVPYLVLHQCDEGGNHNADALLGQCRHLEGDGLPASRRHQPEGVVSFSDAPDDFLLYPPEVVISPIGLEYFVVSLTIPLMKGGRGMFHWLCMVHRLGLLCLFGFDFLYSFFDASDGVLDVVHYFPVIQSDESDSIAFQSLLPFLILSL